MKYTRFSSLTINTETHPHLSKVSKCWDDGVHIIMYDRISGYEHLRIRRKDDKPIDNYLVMQRIKNDLWGNDITAVQIYPAETDFVDGSNTYHLWTWENIEMVAPNLPDLYNYNN